MKSIRWSLFLALNLTVPAMAGPIGPMANDKGFQCYDALAPQIDLNAADKSANPNHIDVNNALRMGLFSLLSYYNYDEIHASGPMLSFNNTHVHHSGEVSTLPQVKANLTAALQDLEEGKWEAAKVLFESPVTKNVIFADSQMAWLENDDYVVLAFRGTEPSLKANIFSDLYSVPEHTDLGVVHKGFYDALQVFWPKIQEYITAMKTPKPIYVTGHSLGGAMAILAVDRLLQEEAALNPKTKEDIMQRSWVRGFYTFGSPRVGSPEFVDKFQEIVKKIGFLDPEFTMGMFEDTYDVVPLVPWAPQYYRQFGDPLVYFRSDGEVTFGPSGLNVIPDLLDILKERHALVDNHLVPGYLKNIGRTLGIPAEKLDTCGTLLFH
jgi:hypothetical protein